MFIALKFLQWLCNRSWMSLYYQSYFFELCGLLPALYLFAAHNFANTGNSSCDHVQIFSRFRVNDAFIASHYQKNMDQPSAVGRVYQMRKSHRPCQLRGAVAAPEGPIARACRQTA